MRLHSITAGLAAVLLFALPALPAMAARYEVQGAISYMGNPSNNYSTPAAFGEVVFEPSQIGSSDFTWSPDVTAGWIGGRDGSKVAEFANDNPSTRDDVFLVAGGARFHFGPASAWYQPLFLSFQPAVHTGRTQALSTVYEFVTTVGYQGSHWSLGVRHISNGSFHEPNRGETMLVAGIAF
ncbi:acyloxyacyl hydrolase [Dyella mobilis]|uniref:Acyloxyacyl hydrolase n=1 Tax=Dyella mobilis TaxID=1849582 RepID=A0ABS2KGD8_9GAMM|nr:acyloxyacyl hydrolase [Dyella mobilis]MBM7129940.1 acyloxyacyl hydrolase [Dyella mobilis]GLQ97797.1 hypothetical protein GCM10007863_22170 [Dyella mobilis]